MIPVFNVFILLETVEKESDVSVRNMSPTVWPQLGTLFRILSSLRNMSLRDNKILERGTQGILALKFIFLSDDKILKRGTQLWSNIWGMFLTEMSLSFSTVSSGMNTLNTGITQCNYITLNFSLKIIHFNPFGWLYFQNILGAVRVTIQ